MQISKRKMLSALCGAVLGMSLAILPFTSAAAASMKLRLGHEMPESHPYHMGAVKFAELVSEKSKGSDLSERNLRQNGATSRRDEHGYS